MTSPAANRDVSSLVDAVVVRVEALCAKAPAATGIADARARAESELFRLAREGGVAGLEQLVSRLAAAGHALEPVATSGPWRGWRETRPQGTLTLEACPGPVLIAASVKWEAPVAAKKETAAARARSALHAAFYRRLDAAAGLGPEAGRPRPRRLARGDRLVRLIGELEADVHNGGFSQYLLNKGRRRARAALLALEEIGAARTARWLRQALDAGEDEAALNRLDAAFEARGEDLAGRCARHLRRIEREG